MSYTGPKPKFEELQAADVYLRDGAVYYGDPETDGTWRVIRVMDALQIERREMGVYVAKDIINP